MINKTKNVIASLAFFAATTIGYSKSIELDPHLTIDDAGEDSTFQVIPDLGVPGKTFCLWNGDDLQAFFITSPEKHKGNNEAFIRATLNGMKKEGAKKVKVVSEDSFEDSEGSTIYSYVVTYKSAGIQQKQIIYTAKIEGGHDMIAVSLTSIDYFSSIKERADKLIKTMKIKG